MTEKTKRILAIIGFITFVIVASFLIWFLFFKPEDTIPNIPNQNANNNNQSGTGTLPVSGTNTGTNIGVDNGQSDTGTTPLTPDQIADIINQNNGQDNTNIDRDNINTGINIGNTSVPEREGDIANGGIVYTNSVTNYPVLNSVVSGNGLITFNSNDGGFYKIDSNTGKSTLITDSKFKGATDIIFAPTSTKAIIEFPDGSNVMYDFNNKKQYTLPKNWYDFSFQKDGEKIAFMIDSNNYNERWLSIANPDGSGFQAIEPLGNNADRVIVNYSPNEQMIALSRTGEPVGGLSQQVLLIGLNDENFKSINVNGRGFHPIWSPDGSKIVYDAYNAETDYNPNLWIVNANANTIGTGYKNVNIATWVSKCGFNSTGQYLYCGVPRGSLPAGSGMFPEDLEEYGIYDDIYKINMSTGVSQLIAKPYPDVSIGSLYVSNKDSIIYYTDSKTGIVYSLKLK